MGRGGVRGRGGEKREGKNANVCFMVIIYGHESGLMIFLEHKEILNKGEGLSCSKIACYI